MVKAALIASTLVSMFSGSNSAGVQLPEAQNDRHVEPKSPQTTEPIRAESQCIATAIGRIFDQAQSAEFPRRKWRIDLEIHRSADQAPKLVVEVEPIDFDPGGGGRITYDCETGHLELIEDFR